MLVTLPLLTLPAVIETMLSMDKAVRTRGVCDGQSSGPGAIVVLSPRDILDFPYNEAMLECSYGNKRGKHVFCKRAIELTQGRAKNPTYCNATLVIWLIQVVKYWLL